MEAGSPARGLSGRGWMPGKTRQLRHEALEHRLLLDIHLTVSHRRAIPATTGFCADEPADRLSAGNRRRRHCHPRTLTMARRGWATATGSSYGKTVKRVAVPQGRTEALIAALEQDPRVQSRGAGLHRHGLHDATTPLYPSNGTYIAPAMGGIQMKEAWEIESGDPEPGDPPWWWPWLTREWPMRTTVAGSNDVL